MVEEYENNIEDDELMVAPLEGDGRYVHHEYTVEKGRKAERVDKYLVNIMSNTSRNRIQKAADNGSILVNDKPVKSSYKIKADDVITIVMSYPKAEYSIVPQDIPLDVVYEDNDILLINKRPNMVVHPGFGNFDGTLLNAVAWHLKDNDDFDANDPRIGLVHRIDKDTSGLILVAKNENAKSLLGKQFFNKTTERTYNALVWGTVKADQGTIVGALARDPRDRMLFTVFAEGENPAAKHAVTHYKVLERFAYCTLVECKLETGRTHQIRVHMKHIGHILFNDERYGGHDVLKGVHGAKYKKFVTNCFDICPRQVLHAKTLGFEHPTTKEWMQFDSELPEDITLLLDKWRKYSATAEQE